MPHGYPDWGVAAPKKTVYVLQDMAELAARLGSIVTFDRRGDVVWLDNFEDNINKWYQDLYAGLGEISLSLDRARNGAKSAKLVTGPYTFYYARIQHYLPLPVTTRIGLEVSFSSEEEKFEFASIILICDGETWHEAAIGYNRITNQLLYLGADGAYHSFAEGIAICRNSFLFHTMKFVMDFATGKYVHCILGSAVYDLSLYSYYTTPYTIYPYMLVELRVTTREDAAKTIYVDDAIVTQNEP